MRLLPLPVIETARTLRQPQPWAAQPDAPWLPAVGAAAGGLVRAGTKNVLRAGQEVEKGIELFGILRWALAVMVMISHLSDRVANGWMGPFAVWAFFVLAGWFCAQAMVAVYGLTWRGSLRFLANRYVRFFPAYGVALSIGLAVAVAVPESAASTNNALHLPRSVLEWTRNLTLVGLAGSAARLVPAAWFLDLLLRGYAIAVLAMLWRKKAIWLMAAASVGVAVYLLAIDAPRNVRYGYPLGLGATLPFMLGAALSVWPGPIRSRSRGVSAAASWGSMTTAGLLSWLVIPDARANAMYVSLPAAACFALLMSGVSRDWLPAWLRRLDRELGALSYPVYLLHWPVAVLCVHLFFGGFPPADWSLFLVCFVPVHVLSWLVVRLVVMPTERIRSRLRRPTTKE